MPSLNNYDNQNYLVEFGNIKKVFNKFVKQFRKKFSRKPGYVLIVFTFFFFMIAMSLITGPIIISTKEMQFQMLRSQLEIADSIALSINSPIRNTVVNQIYKSAQNQLIQHLQFANGSSPYPCQGQYTQPTKYDPLTGTTTADLTYQYGLCNPELLLLTGLSAGDTNQSVDFLSGLYAEYKTPLSTKEHEYVRKGIIKDTANNFSYTLRSTYVGEDVLSQGASSSTLANRIERYHWLVRADVEVTTSSYKEVITPMIVYYDVFLTNSFYTGGFYGGGNACDQTPTYSNNCGVDSTGKAISCIPAMVVNPDGSRGFAVQFGDDDPNYSPISGGKCTTVDVGGILPEIQCPLSGGRTSIEFQPKSTRMQTGCASLSTGVSGVTSPDPNGYGFVITVRTSTIGKPYS